jgi:hypothetical protein
MTRATTYAIRTAAGCSAWRLYTGVFGVGELPNWYDEALDAAIRARYDFREDAAVFRRADLLAWLAELPPFEPPATVLAFVEMCTEELEEPMVIRLFLERMLQLLPGDGAAAVLIRRE